jgi:hypothetical protein
MTRALALILALTLSGCVYKSMTEIAISPEFTPRETETIIEATEAWFEAAPELRVPVYIGYSRNRGAIMPAPPRICTDKVIGDTRLRPIIAPRIRLCAPEHGMRVYLVAALHELGHAFSMSGVHLPKGNVMAETIDGRLRKLTAADVAHVTR